MPSVADAIVSVWRRGTRLRSVTGDAPKSLATIGGRPFLEILLSQLRRHGFEHVILAVGYQRDLIRSHFGDRAHGIVFGILDRIGATGNRWCVAQRRGSGQVRICADNEWRQLHGR